VVRVGDTSLDYMDVKDHRGGDGEIVSQHYAFLVSEVEFDEIFERIRQRRLPFWADPGREQRGQIDAWDDGRGSPSRTRTDISSRSSRVRMAAAARSRPDLIRWWRARSSPRTPWARRDPRAGRTPSLTRSA